MSLIYARAPIAAPSVVSIILPLSTGPAQFLLPDDQATDGTLKSKKEIANNEDPGTKFASRGMAKEGPSILKGMPELVHFNQDKGNDNDTCTVSIRDSDETYDDLGFISLENLSDGFGNMSWTIAVRTEDDDTKDNSVSIYKDLFLGTDLGVDESKIGGCALTFTDVNQETARYDGEDDDEDDGSCGGALSTECVNAVLELARTVTPKVPDYCFNLLRKFEDKLDSACAGFVNQGRYGNKWGSLQVTTLFNNSTTTLEHPKASSRKGKDDVCWPVADKDYNLTLVTEAQSNWQKNDTEGLEATIYKVVPILTYLFKHDGTILQQPETRLTCVKPLRRSGFNGLKSKQEPDEEGRPSPNNLSDDSDDSEDDGTRPSRGRRAFFVPGVESVMSAVIIAAVLAQLW